MYPKTAITSILLGVFLTTTATVAQFETDTIQTSAGQLRITFVGHASLILTLDTTVIQVDPYGALTDYAQLPKADLVLITHEHPDHLDLSAIAQIRSPRTVFVISQSCIDQIPNGIVFKNGSKKTISGIGIEAVAAYNLVHQRETGEPYHPKGRGNGYVLTIGKTRIYIAGDTENIPEMKGLKNIDIAFLPMNLPYTMTPEMAADGARLFGPKVLYPYHYGKSDCAKLVALLKGDTSIEVRIRRMM